MKPGSASPLTASTFAAETTAGDYQRYTSLNTGRVWSSMVSIRIGFLVNREECIAIMAVRGLAGTPRFPDRQRSMVGAMRPGPVPDLLLAPYDADERMH